MRARKLVTGTDMTINEVRKSKVKLVLLAKDASDNTKKKVYDKCKFYDTKVLEIFTSEELSNPIGKKNIMVLGITDQGFSKNLLNQIKEVNKNGQKTNETNESSNSNKETESKEG